MYLSVDICYSLYFLLVIVKETYPANIKYSRSCCGEKNLKIATESDYLRILIAFFDFTEVIMHDKFFFNNC